MKLLIKNAVLVYFMQYFMQSNLRKRKKNSNENDIYHLLATLSCTAAASSTTKIKAKARPMTTAVLAMEESSKNRSLM